MSKLGAKIAQRLVEIGALDGSEYDLEKTGIDRHRPGHWQRSGGAWSWSLELVRKDGGTIVYDSFGSQFSATECAKAPEWQFYTTGHDKGIVPVKGDTNE